MSIPLAIMATDDYLCAPENLAQIPNGYEVQVCADWRDWPTPQLLERCRQVEIIVTGRHSPRLPEDLIADRGRLRWLSHLHGTIRHLVTKAHLEAGLIVTNWGDTIRPISEGGVVLLLCMIKQVVELNHLCTTGSDRRIWQDYHATVQGMDVGLYGFGPIGRQCGSMLAPLGARLAVYDPYAESLPDGVRRCRSLDELFGSCQAVIVACGLNDQTRGSVGRDLLEKLPQGGILVNIARGAIVVERDLAAMVGAGRILAACDVIEDESNWPGSPLAGLPGAVLTRHTIGRGKGFGPDSRPLRPLPDFLLENLHAWLDGRGLKYEVTADIYDLKT